VLGVFGVFVGKQHALVCSELPEIQATQSL